MIKVKFNSLEMVIWAFQSLSQSVSLVLVQYTMHSTYIQYQELSLVSGFSVQGCKSFFPSEHFSLLRILGLLHAKIRN